MKAYVKTVKRAKRLCDMAGEMEELERGKLVGDLVAGREGGESRGVRGDTKMKRAEARWCRDGRWKSCHVFTWRTALTICLQDTSWVEKNINC